ncbi:MAG: 2'-5' RNA ligase family protein [Propionibacteriaceae bacterium]
MAQSVELLLDPETEALVEGQWLALHDAGLPSEHRSQHAGSHRPHVTLFAGASLPEPESELTALVVDAPGMPVTLGSVLLFGPRRGQYVVVRQLLPTVALLELQEAVASWCGALRGGPFGPGRWAAHLTLARRARAEDLPAMLALLAGEQHSATVTGVRRWDGTAKRDWLL